MKKEKFKKLKNEILDNFNFKKIAKAMKAVGWVYAPISKVPDADYLKEFADELLDSVYENKFAECGGFRAKRTKHKLSLKFVFEHYEVYDDDDK